MKIKPSYSLMWGMGPILRRNPIYRGRVGHWLFNEGGGETIYDISGNGNNGTLFGPTWSYGAYGPAALLDGVNDYCSIPHTSLISPTSEMTITGWFQLTGAPASYAGLLMKTGSGSWDNGYGCYWRDDAGVGSVNSLTFFINHWDGTGGSGAMAYKALDFVNDRSSHHFAGTFNGTTASLYIDGVKGTDDSFTGAITTTTAPLHLGTFTISGGLPSTATNAVTPCLLSSICIFDRAISDSEVYKLAYDPISPFRQAFEQMSRADSFQASSGSGGSASPHMYYYMT